MKKLIISLVAVTFLVCGMAFAYDEGSDINQREISGGTASDPVRFIQLVRNPEVGDDVASLSAGSVVVWDINSDDGVTINVVTAAGQSNDAVAGVTVGSIPTSDGARTAANSVGRREWGYIQTYGYTDDCMVDATTAVAAGQSLIACPAVPGKACIGSTTNRTQAIIGFAFDAVSSVGDEEVFLRLR